MTDTYSQLVNNPVGGFIAKNLGLPQPVQLERHREGAPLIDGAVLVGSAPGGRLGPAIAQVLAEEEVHTDSALDDEVRAPLGAAGVAAGGWYPGAPARPRW
jgi:3-oxoacyl-[acyl-carrier protein] reductase